jgi:6-bladed beta-propeller protein/NHL repeat-containing protein
MKTKIIWLVLLVISLTLLSGCTSLGTNNVEQNKLINQVWPLPPARPRIQFEQAFSTAEELGIGRSFWQWLGDVVFGADEMHMLRPMDVITVDEHLIYVADPGVRGVHRFDTRDQSYQLIQDKQQRGLPSPVALAADKNGNVYVSDSSLAQILIIHKNSDYAQNFELNASLRQPTGLAIEKKSGDIFLLDTLQHQVLVFNSVGELIKRMGQRGVKPGEFNFPTHIQVKNKKLLVTDSLNFRIQIFNLDGKYLQGFGQAGQSSGYLSRPKGVAMDGLGNVYVVDSLLNNIQIFKQSGELLMTMGEQGLQAGQFWLPTGIHITDQQKIYIADSHNRRVQVFRYVGEAL